RAARRPLPADRRRRDGRVPSPAYASLIPDVSAGRACVRDPRLAVGRGLGAGLGCRPPQTPCPRRRGGRSPLAARRARQRPCGPLARTRGLVDQDTGTGELEALRARAVRGPQDAPRGQALSTVGGADAAAADVRRLCAARLDSSRRDPPLRLGWPGADLPSAP